MKKLMTFLASITALSCLCAGCLPMAEQIPSMDFVIASAEDTEKITTSGTCGENLTWNFEESTGTLTISGTGAMDDWNWRYDNNPEWAILNNIKKVIIEDGVTTIGNGAFGWDKTLESVIISDSVTTIGDEAFTMCESLTSVAIPDSVTTIKDFAFSGTPWLETKINENPLVIINGILIDGTTCQQEEIVIPDSVTTIGNRAFGECESLSSVIISDNVTNIGNGAFWGCESLTSVTIPDNVTNIGNEAFWGCKSLTSVTIPDNVTAIGNFAFSGCESLTSVIIPDSVTTIGGNSFEDTPWLKNKRNENPIIIINGILIDGQTCEQEEIIIPDNVTSIGAYAFFNCESLTSVTIPESVTSIEESAFFGCSALTSVTIPDSVTTIGDDAFDWCSALTSVTIPDSVTTIGEGAFNQCPLESVTIPDSITAIGLLAFVCPINVSENNANYSSQDGGLFNKEKSELIFLYDNNITEYIIPDSVTTIGEHAFHCSSLTSITIPDSVTAIGYLVLEDCSSLTSVTIENPKCKFLPCHYYKGEHWEGWTIGEEVTIYGYDNSTAQAYAEKYERNFVSLGTAPAPADTDNAGTTWNGMNPDLNGDGKIDAADAAVVLMFAADYGAGNVSNFAEFMEKRQTN
ncbi:MAG: leucine-rich repeat protein [Oscillospiraceae bacterium]|nr:leucine-rich repeat protein [Oscillospiraceae bacterium]